MKIGDMVIETSGAQWIIMEIFDFSTGEIGYILRGFDNHMREACVTKKDIIYHEPKPENVEWLFLERRKKLFKGAEHYL